MAAEERLWIVQADESGEVNPAELAEAMMEVAGILRRIGGGVSMISRRRRVLAEPPLFLTERIDIQWAPHAPLPRRRREEPVEAPEPDIEEEPVPEMEPAAVSG